MNILQELDKLRMAAIGGDSNAAIRAVAVADHIETKSTAPPEMVRAARCLALDASGYAIRHATDRALIRARGAGASQVEILKLATEMRRQMEEWKRQCDALVEMCITAADDRLAATLLHMRCVHQLQEVQSYLRVAPWDQEFKAEKPVLVMEGLARATGARDLFAKQGIHEMRIKSMGLEIDWHWVGGDHSNAKAAAERLIRDPEARHDPKLLEAARRVVAGGSPMPEYDALPAIDSF